MFLVPIELYFNCCVCLKSSGHIVVGSSLSTSVVVFKSLDHPDCLHTLVSHTFCLCAGVSICECVYEYVYVYV